MARVAVENGLDRYAAYLHNAGYDVEQFFKSMRNDSFFFENFDAVVLMKNESDVLEIEHNNTNTSAINESFLNNQGATFSQAAVNVDFLNQNIIGLNRHSSHTSKPTVFVNRKSPEEVKAELDSLLVR